MSIFNHASLERTATFGTAIYLKISYTAKKFIGENYVIQLTSSASSLSLGKNLIVGKPLTPYLKERIN